MRVRSRHGETVIRYNLYNIHAEDLGLNTNPDKLTKILISFFGRDVNSYKKGKKKLKERQKDKKS